MTLAVFALFIFAAAAVNAQTTAFTYQGRLTEAAASASGTYDFEFALYDGEGTQQGATQTIGKVPVAGGVFTVSLDFGSAPFLNGEDRHLEIRVKRSGDEGYTTLSPRQHITSVPYAIQSQNSVLAASADGLSANCAGCVSDAQIAGISGSKVTGSVPQADSAANATIAGSAANFSGNLAGDVTGTQGATVVNKVGGQTAANIAAATTTANAGTSANTPNTLVKRDANGNFAAGTITAATQFNIGGSRVLSVGGQGNLFAGVNAGTVNTGFSNTFVGANAGLVNTTGFANSFAGESAGRNNSTGHQNSFFGNGAGGVCPSSPCPDLTGQQNSFFGANAGGVNTTGANNSFVGAGAGDKNATGGNNSFFGSFAGQNNTTGTNNIGIGFFAGANLTTSSNNIDIGNSGVAAESNMIRIGASQTDTFLTGVIHGNGSALTNLPAGTIADGSVTSAMIADGTIVNADVSSSAAIADTKLATISTALKVSNSATTATSANTANAIVARDANGDFSAGKITANGSALTNLNGVNLTNNSVTPNKLAPVYGFFYLSFPQPPVAPSAAVQFLNTGPVNGIVSNGSSFTLPSTGVYEVTWQVPIREAGALVLTLNGSEQIGTSVGRDTGSTQIVGNVLINANAGDVLSIRAGTFNSTALTIPFTVGGGFNPITGSLVIKQIN